MSQITDDTTVVMSDETLSTTLDGEAVILHTSSGEYFGFNTVGSDIWSLIDEPTTVTEITEHITDKYDVTEDRCRTDIEELLTELVDKDLVHIVQE